MNREEIINSRVIYPKDFLGKRYKPSNLIKKNFTKIFSLIYPDFESKYEIKDINFDQDKFRIMLNHKELGEILDLSVTDNSSTTPCKGPFCTSKLCIGMHDNRVSESYLYFLHYFKKRADFLSFEYLLEILAKDPRAKKLYYQIFWKSKRPPISIIQDWGHPLHKVRYLVPEGILRNFDQSISLNITEIQVHHSERECLGITPNVSLEKELHFFSYPKEFYDHSFDKYFYLSQTEKDIITGAQRGHNKSIFTDLAENDIIMGKGNEILEKNLEYAISQIEELDAKILSFNCCCVPRVVGDDVNSILAKYQSKIDIPFIFQGQLEKTPFEQKILLLEDYLNKLDKKTLSPIKNSIALFGYHENIHLKYLNDILDHNSIRLNAIYIPTINIDLLKKLYETELFIFSKNKYQEEIFEYPFKNLGVKYISPDYPYGIKSTNDWLNSIGKELGIESIILRDEDKDNINEYKNLVEYIKSKKYRIGFVFLGKQEIDIFFNKEYTNNVDVIGFIEEMGFSIDFFIYDNFGEFAVFNNENKFSKEDADHELIEKEIFSKIQNKEAITINYVSSEEELKEKFKIINPDLIYTDIYFDDRIYKLGKNQLNISHFSAGYVGALESIRKIIKTIELSYYKDFGKYV